MTTWSPSVTATVTQGRTLSRWMSRTWPAPWLRLRAPTWLAWRCPACACAAEANRPGAAQSTSVSQSWQIKWAVSSEYDQDLGSLYSGVMNVWMRLRSWLALCAYWGSGISEATSGCDNGQYERNDQMWTRVTEDLIDHCSMRLILTKDMYCTLCILSIEISDNFQEVFNPSKDHKNLFRG